MKWFLFLIDRTLSTFQRCIFFEGRMLIENISTNIDLNFPALYLCFRYMEYFSRNLPIIDNVRAQFKRYYLFISLPFKYSNRVQIFRLYIVLLIPISQNNLVLFIRNMYKLIDVNDLTLVPRKCNATISEDSLLFHSVTWHFGGNSGIRIMFLSHVSIHFFQFINLNKNINLQ